MCIYIVFLFFKVQAKLKLSFQLEWIDFALAIWVPKENTLMGLHGD